VIPRAEVRHVEVVALGGDNWAVKYQLAGTVVVRSIEWKGDCRPPTLKDKIEIKDYNLMAAETLQTILTRGHRDLHLTRRSDGVILTRSGLAEEDERSVMCRSFIAKAAIAVLPRTFGPVERNLLQQIVLAAQDLRLPEEYQLAPQEDA
jgi:hypothetical protein